MEKTTEIVYGLIERMALVSDAIDNLFVNGKKVIVVELNKFDFEEIKKQLPNTAMNHDITKVIEQRSKEMGGLKNLMMDLMSLNAGNEVDNSDLIGEAN